MLSSGTLPSLATRPDDSSLSFFDELQDYSYLRSNVDIIDMKFDVDNAIVQDDFNNDDSFFRVDADNSFFKTNYHLPKPLNFPIALLKMSTAVKFMYEALVVLSIIKHFIYIYKNLRPKSSRLLKLLYASKYSAV